MDMYDWGAETFGLDVFDLNTFAMGVGFGELGNMDGFAPPADWDAFLLEMSELSHRPHDMPPIQHPYIDLEADGASEDGGLFDKVVLWFAPIIIGPLLGAVGGFVEGFVDEMRDGDGDFDWGNVLNDTLRGALSGALGGIYAQGGKYVGSKFLEHYVGPGLGILTYEVFDLPPCETGQTCI